MKNITLKELALNQENIGLNTRTIQYFLDLSKLLLSQEKLFERRNLIFLNQIHFLKTRKNYLSKENIGLSLFRPIFS